MKCLALAAASAAVVGLAACSQSPAPASRSAAPASHRAVTPAAMLTCAQQYDTWERGDGKGVTAALNAVSSADTAGNTNVLTAALKEASPAFASATRYPIPACADPKGYWMVLLMHVSAAAASGAPASSVHAAMKGVPEIEHELTAEIERTAG
jgi:hypothetical protein